MRKNISMSTLSKRSFQVDKKRYRSLIASVFLTIFFTTSMFLAVVGINQRRRIQYEEAYGKQDAILLNVEKVNDEELLQSGHIKAIGHIYVLGQLGDTGLTLGYYDESANNMVGTAVLQGRMPEKPGEIALTNRAIQQLRTGVKIGETFEFSLKIPDGQNGFLPQEQVKEYTLVGIVKEKLINDSGAAGQRGVLQSPDLFVASTEEVSPGGRAVINKAVEFSLFSKEVIMYKNKGLKYLSENKDISLFDTYSYSFYSLGVYEMDYISIAIFALLIGSVFVLMGVVGIISNYMANLDIRKNEIGMLRAIGATHKQIRSLYGRETWILIAVTAPLSMAASVLFTWFLSIAASSVFVFHVKAGFIAIALALSALVIYLAAQIPLHKAAKTSPMQALRDTSLLRAKRKTNIKSEKTFQVATLLAKRQSKLYKIKQVGISAVVAISILLLTIMAPTMYEYFKNIGAREAYPFDIFKSSSSTMYFVEPATKQYYFGEGEVGEMLQLPLVNEVKASASAKVNILLEELSPYITQMHTYLLSEEEKNQRAAEDKYFSSYEADIEEKIKNYFHISKDILQSRIITVPEEVLQTMVKGENYEGEINLTALNAGEEVLLIAPKYLYDYWTTAYSKTQGNLWTEEIRQRNQQYSSQEEEDFFSTFLEEYAMIAQYENDVFTPGMPLSLYQLYTENIKSVGRDWEEITNEELESIKEAKADTKVGAILDENIRHGRFYYFGEIIVITTQQGLKELGIQNKGYDQVDIGLASIPDPQTEEYIQTSLENLALRGEGMIVNNGLARARLNKQMIWMVFIGTLAIIVLFFFMTVNMVNSAITNRIRSDKRAIGTLRAVGADLKELTSSYFKQILYMLVKGVVIGTVLSAVYIGVWILYYEWNKQLNMFPWWMPFVYFGYLSLILLLCTIHCKKRLKEVIRFSIIENIRDL